MILIIPLAGTAITPEASSIVVVTPPVIGVVPVKSVFKSKYIAPLPSIHLDVFTPVGAVYEG